MAGIGFPAVAALPSAPSAAAPAGTTITGIIYRDNPARGREFRDDVSIYWVEPGGEIIPENHVDVTITGNFYLPELPGDSYLLYAQYTGSDGYRSQWLSPRQLPNVWAVPTARDYIDLSGGSVYLEFSLSRPRDVSGVVSLGTRADSRVAGAGEAAVSFRYRTSYWDNFAYGEWSAPVLTDEFGGYSLPAMEPGSYVFRFSYTGADGEFQTDFMLEDLPYNGGWRPLGVRSYVPFPALSVTIPPPGVLTGRVALGSTGMPPPVGSVVVTLDRTTWRSPDLISPIPSVSIAPDAQGNYSIPLNAGVYTPIVTYVGSGAFETVTRSEVEVTVGVEGATESPVETIIKALPVVLPPSSPVDSNLRYINTVSGWTSNSTGLDIVSGSYSAVNMGGSAPQLVANTGGYLHQIYFDGSRWQLANSGLAIGVGSQVSAVNMGGSNWPQIVVNSGGYLHQVWADSGGWHIANSGLFIGGGSVSAVNMGGNWPQVTANVNGTLHQAWGDSAGWHLANSGLPLGSATLSAVDMGGDWPGVVANLNGTLHQAWGDSGGWHLANSGLPVGSGALSAVNMGGSNWPQAVTNIGGYLHQIYVGADGWALANSGLSVGSGPAVAVNMGGQWPQGFALR